jgi:hypothetical protein
VGPLGGSAGEVTAGEGGGLGDAGHGGEPCTSCAGGTAGSGGIAATMLYDFDVDEQGWNVQYSAAGSLLNGDPATSIPLSSVITQWTTGNGFGDGGGALKITVPYTSEAQYVGIGLHLNAEDLSGKIITAHVKLVTGLEDPTDLPMNPAGAKIYAKAGVAYTYAAGAFSNVDTVGKWLTLRFDLGDRTTWSYEDTTNDAFDPSQVGEVGVQFDTGGATTTAQTAVLLIDSVSW